jgi:hypothetical protein
MSLLRLLTAGKSLVGAQDAEPRYRATTQRLLPKFGSAKNPFIGRKAATAASAPSGEAARVMPCAPQPASAPPSGALGVARPTWLRRLLSTALAERVRGWTAKATERFTRPKVKPAKPAIPQFSKPPVQAELSLERVKVLRNDLSDADLEVVAAKTKPAPAAAPVQAPLIAERPLGRVATRLFGVGKT